MTNQGRIPPPTNRNQNAIQVARRMVRASARRDAGHKVVPSLRPPQIVRLPWNSYTFSATYNTSTANEISITVGNIRQQIISLMGLAGASGAIGLKVSAARGWNTATGPQFAQPSMQGIFYELIPVSAGETYNARSEQYDHGTLNIPSRVGYTWPLADRKEIHSQTTDSHVICKFSTPASLNTGNVTVRVHVLWQIGATSSNLALTFDPSEEFELIPHSA